MTPSNEARNVPDGTVYAARTDRCRSAVGGVPRVMSVDFGVAAPAWAMSAGAATGASTAAEPSATVLVEPPAHPATAKAATSIVKPANAWRVCIGGRETLPAAPKFPGSPWLCQARHNAIWIKRRE